MRSVGYRYYLSKWAFLDDYFGEAPEVSFGWN